MQQQQTTMQPNKNFGNNGGGNLTRTPKNPYRIYANYNYCHTCGCHVHDDHTSATCKTPGPHHNRNVPHQNPMGGSVVAVYKTAMPEQCGREENQNLQPNPSQGYLSWAASGFQGTHMQHEEKFRGQRGQHQQQQQRQVFQQANTMAPMMMLNQMAPHMMAPHAMMMGQPAPMLMIQQQQVPAMQQQQMMAPMV
jgi:hypothetical protein